MWDVTSYLFRKLLSTRCLSNDCKEIHDAEQEALQHSLKVAKDDHKLNKQLKPQMVSQKYCQEEQIFPEKIKSVTKEKNTEILDIIKRNEKKILK